MREGYAISIMGPPLAGKSNQAERLARKFGNLKVVDTGQILRDFDPAGNPVFLEAKEKMARRDLIDSSVVQHILEAELKKRYDVATSPEVELLIFCGSPRKLPEATWLVEKMLPSIGFALRHVYLLEVPVAELDRRRQKRKNREQEDTPEGFAMGLQKFNECTVPVIKHFEAMNLLVRIDGDRSKEDVTACLASHIFARTSPAHSPFSTSTL